MRNILRGSGVALIGLVFLGIAPAASAGTRFNVPVTATNADGSTFSGTFSPQSYQVIGSQLVAIGTLDGTVTDGTTSSPAVETVGVPISLSASALALTVTVGPVDVTLAGEPFTLPAITNTILAKNALESRVFAAIGAFLATPGALNKIAFYLNLLLQFSQ